MRIRNTNNAGIGGIPFQMVVLPSKSATTVTAIQKQRTAPENKQRPQKKTF